MTDFTVTVDLGPDASTVDIASVVRAVQDIALGAVALAEIDTRRRGEDEIRTLLVPGREAQLAERLGPYTDDPDAELRRNLMLWLPYPPNTRYERDPERVYGILNGLDPWSSALSPAARRWLSSYEAEHPTDEPTIRALTYNNPIELIIGASAGAALALGWLLGVIRDFPARRRIANAAAQEAENVVTARQQLRQQLLQAHARGELSASPAEVMAAIGEDPLIAIQRLQAIDASVVEREQGQ